MKKRLFAYSAVALLVTILIMGVDSAAAFESITAQEAYDMVMSGQATLIDVRTLEECYWVGFPDVVSGGLYIIPIMTITINPDATFTILPNPHFIELIEQEFGDNKGQALITMCRSGSRSTRAAEVLEAVGFTNVFEMDNALAEENNYPGGFGGLQGSNYGGTYDGYRGYPGRIPPRTGNPLQIGVGINTDLIKNEETSVSWMDTGLPITQDLSKAIIPVPNQ